MRNLFTAVVLLVCMTAQAFAATTMPQTISFQAKLTLVTGGAPVDGVTSVVFNIYDVSTAGTALWTETQSIDVDNGNLVALLGSVTPIALPCDEPYWLGVTVGTDAEMTPRFEMASSAYAMRAQVAESALVLGAATTEATLTAALALKADDAATTAALALKADIAALNDDDNTTVPVGWTDLVSVPATFPPDVHAHSSLDASDGNPANVLAIDADGFANLNQSTGSSKGTANLYVQRPDNDYGENKSCINAYRYGLDAPPPGGGGTAWGASYVDTAIKGLSDFGNEYSAAIAGYGVLDYDNSAAIIGANWDGSTRAMLAYNFGGITYAGYFVGPVNASANLSVGDSLDVTNDLAVGGTVTAAAITMPTGAAAGSVLTSDAAGNASWAATATPSAHVHSGADVTSGTVGNAYFSAYSDLTAEGYLDNNAGTDLPTRAQGDVRYRSVASYITTGAFVHLGNTATNYFSISITTPGPGTVIVTANVRLGLVHTNGITNHVILAIGTTAADMGDVFQQMGWMIPSAYPSASLDTTHIVRRTFTVAGAGTYTYYINGFMNQGFTANTDYFDWGSADALYIP